MPRPFRDDNISSSSYVLSNDQPARPRTHKASFHMALCMPCNPVLTPSPPVGGNWGVSSAAERNRSLTERGSRATSGARHLDDQVDQALCLTLVTNAAVLWTATYLGDALDAPRRT